MSRFCWAAALFENAVEAERDSCYGGFELVRHRMVKITQESVGDLVLPTQEPLGILLDACVEEECSMMACRLDADGCLDWVNVNSGEFLEICLAEPTCGSGAVRH